MSPIDAPTAVRRARRGRVVSRLVRFGLTAGCAVGFVLIQGRWLPVGVAILFGSAMASFVVALRGQRMQQGLLRAAAMLDAGEPAEADRLASVVLRRSSLVARPWPAALRLLATARAAQAVPQDARQLADAALRTGDAVKADRDAMRLIAVAGALAANDLPAAHAALGAFVPPLSLAASLRNLELQTDYCLRVGAWQHATADLPAKVELVELMPAPAAAAVQAMLALAARRLGQPVWSAWLARRAGLLTDAATLVRDRPALSELFADPAAGPAPPRAHV